VDALLRESGLTPSQIDLVALAGVRAAAREWMNRVLHDQAYAREYYGEPGALEAAGQRRSALPASVHLVHR
jgi:hypothetical protein